MTGAVVGASALGLDYVLGPRPGPANQSTVTLNPMRSTSNQNHPPVANFKYKPYYLDPTDQQTIQFTSHCYDADNDPLQYAWSVDGEEESAEKDYSTQLPAGDHSIELRVSDGVDQDRVRQTVTVEPDQIYPVRELKTSTKGISYFVDIRQPSTRPMGAMEEHLDSIRGELGCNGIRIEGLDETILDCVKLAIDHGFEVIMPCPHYYNYDSHETAKKIAEFAAKTEKLRGQSDRIILQIGNEFTLDKTGIIEGDNWTDRASSFGSQMYSGWENRFESFIVEVVQSARTGGFGGKISYAAMMYEPVPWEMFDVVCINEYIAYYRSTDQILSKIKTVNRYGLPVYISEFGCCSFVGADYWGGIGPTQIKVPGNQFVGPTYDEDVQARYIDEFTKSITDRTRIEGCFLFDFDSLNNVDRRLTGIVDQGHRKKGFYMYKSYQRSS